MSSPLLMKEGDALREVIRRPRAVLAQLAGNALLLALLYGWLALPDRAVWQVALSALYAAALLIAALVLHGACFASFQESAASLPFQPVLRRLPRLLVCFLLLVALYLVTGWLRDYAPSFTAWLSNWLTATFRRPISPQAVRWLYPSFVAVLHVAGWLALLPLFSLASSGNALRLAPRALGRLRYWLSAVILAALGYYAARALVNWTPQLDGLPLQTVSMALRFGLAWLWAVVAWLALAAWVAQFLRQSPVEPG